MTLFIANKFEKEKIHLSYRQLNKKRQEKWEEGKKRAGKGRKRETPNCFIKRKLSSHRARKQFRWPGLWHQASSVWLKTELSCVFRPNSGSLLPSNCLSPVTWGGHSKAKQWPPLTLLGHFLCSLCLWNKNLWNLSYGSDLTASILTKRFRVCGHCVHYVPNGLLCTGNSAGDISASSIIKNMKSTASIKVHKYSETEQKFLGVCILLAFFWEQNP